MATPPIEEDDAVRAAIDWLTEVDDRDRRFTDRLVAAQDAYRDFMGRRENLGKDLRFREFSLDLVASYFAQAK